MQGRPNECCGRPRQSRRRGQTRTFRPAIIFRIASLKGQFPMSRISSQPTDGLTYNATEPKYWNREGLDKEVIRVFDICQGCRLCFNLCPSFPALFDAVDKKDGDVRQLSAEEKRNVVDLCYLCKMCEIRCPYTPQDGHEFQLDFPRLMQRDKAVTAKESGIQFRDKMLSNPDRLGKLGTLLPGA